MIQTSCQLLDLPDEILMNIGDYLRLQDLKSAALSCKKLESIVRELQNGAFQLKNISGENRSITAIIKLINLSGSISEGLYSNSEMEIFSSSIAALKQFYSNLDKEDSYLDFFNAIGTRLSFDYNLKPKEIRNELLSKQTQEKIQKIQELYLVDRLLEYIPPEIGNFSQINKLFLNFNEFKAFPMEILALKKLVILNLSDNELTNIPEEIKELNKLEELNVRDNQLDKLPYGIYQIKNLKKLNFSYNKIQFIQPNIKNLKNLEVLLLNFNKLETLPDAIGELKELKILTILENPINSLPEGMRKLDLDEIEIDPDKSSLLPSKIPDWITSPPSLKRKSSGETESTIKKRKEQ